MYGKQFDILEFLLNSQNTIITKEQIFDKIWGFNSDTTTNVVEVYASNLRKTLNIEFAELEDKSVNMDLKFGKEISIDESKISQLAVILLDNAIKYTRSGDSITIRTYSKDNKCVLK